MSKNEKAPHIAVACATNRGVRFVKKLHQLLPEAELTIFSFREEPWEPPFLDELKQFSEESGSRLLETRRLHASDMQDLWRENRPDLLFSVAWRYMFPSAVFLRPKLGTFVFHDSVLPRYRGFAPTVWAIINGECETGATLFQLTGERDEVDSGPIVAQRSVQIGPAEDIASVVDRVTCAYLEILEANLKALLEERSPRREQDEALATYTCKRIPADNRIDWKKSAREIYNLVRGSTRPYPGAFTELGGTRITIWKAALVEDGASYVGVVPGRVVSREEGRGVTILTGGGRLFLSEVQRENEEPTTADRVIRKISDTLS